MDRDDEYLNIVRKMKCIVPRCATWRVHPHHVWNGGKGLKCSDYDVVPLCPKHHRELHDIGKISFLKKYFPNRSWEELIDKTRTKAEEIRNGATKTDRL